MIWIGDWSGGSLVPEDEALVSVRDRGFTVGEGAFETVRVTDGRPFALRRHLDRLEQSARIMRLPPVDRGLLLTAIDEVLLANAPVLGAFARLRVTYSAGVPLQGATAELPTVVVMVTPATPWPATASVVVAPWQRSARTATTGAKCTSYADSALALAWARDLGADEALVANTEGELCEGTASNVFVVVDGELLTPPLSSGCLPGVTRQLVIEWCGAVERTLSVEVLEVADEVVLTSSTRMVHPVRRIGERELAPGPVARAAQAVFAQRASADVDP